MFKNLLFITGHRKSGTTMFANLFDGHKDFLVYPSDLCLLYAYYPFFIKSKKSFKLKKKRILHILSKDLGNVVRSHKISNIFNLKKMLKIVDKKINNRNINSIKSIIKIVLKSYEQSLKFKKKYKYFVIKETSQDIFFNKLFSKNDKIKFLHLIRDPRDNYASLKSGAKKYYKFLGEDESRLLFSLINRAKLDFRFIEINKKVFGKKNYREIKFENLTKNPKKTMLKISRFLNVKFENTLLFPSILGQRTKGNNYSGENFYDISTKNVNRWKERINDSEAKIIEFYFEREMKKYKYKISTKKIEKNISAITNFYEWTNYNYFFYDSFK